MKRLLTWVIVGLTGLFLAQVNYPAFAAEEGSELPPVAQPVVREGDFAIRLAEALRIGTALSETEAESHLAEMGILPPNGWIADYPVTPDIVEALYGAVGEAGEANKLPMSKEEALKKYSELTVTLGLPIRPSEETPYAQEPPPVDYGSYSDSSVINSYYYNQGLPLITYYTPPWDYYYLYSWVPYPFCWGQTGFGGFFILNDFYTFQEGVIVRNHGHRFVTHKRVTNHFYDRERKRFRRVEPVERLKGHRFAGFRHDWDGRGFGSGPVRKGAAQSIFKRQSERARSFRGGQIGERKGFSPGFENDRFRGTVSMHRFDSSGRNEQNRPLGSVVRPGLFQGGESQRGAGHTFENRVYRFKRDDLRTFGSRSGDFHKSFNTPGIERRGRNFRSQSFSSGRRIPAGWQFSKSGSRGGGRSYSRSGSSMGGRFSSGGFSMSPSFGRGGRR